MSTKKTPLSKCDKLIERLNELKKTLNDVQFERRPMPTLGAGWSQSPSDGSLHHHIHGVINTTPHPQGGYNISHNGDTLRVADIGAASRCIRDTVMDLNKGNYGKFQGGSQYSLAANVKRKATNVGDVAGVGPNTNVKAISTKPGQLSAKRQAATTKFKGAAGPVKQYTPEQIAAENEARKFKKNAEELPWVRHAGVPNADRELAKLQKSNPVNRAEELMPNQLANMMAGRSMLGMTPPKQPTDQEMFGHLIPSEEQIQKAEDKWNNTFNWLQEAQKPISARFNSPEEEEQYWNSIRVADRDDGKPGY